MELNDSTVERLEPLFKSQQGQTFWWLLKLKAEKQEFALNQNWVPLFGPLKPSDKVQYVISKRKFEGYSLFDKLRKTEEKKEDLEVKAEL